MFCTNCGKEIPAGSTKCVFCDKQKNENEYQSSQKVKLIIDRQKRFVGLLVAIEIRIDGEYVTDLKNGNTYEIDLPYGTHNIEFLFLNHSTTSAGTSWWKETLSHTIDCSQEYKQVYISIAVKAKFTKNVPIILEIKKEK